MTRTCLRFLHSMMMTLSCGGRFCGAYLSDRQMSPSTFFGGSLISRQNSNESDARSIRANGTVTWPGVGKLEPVEPSGSSGYLPIWSSDPTASWSYIWNTSVLLLISLNGNLLNWNVSLYTGFRVFFSFFVVNFFFLSGNTYT